MLAKKVEVELLERREENQECFHRRQRKKQCMKEESVPTHSLLRNHLE
jgi:hypothetical protein